MVSLFNHLIHYLHQELKLNVIHVHALTTVCHYGSNQNINFSPVLQFKNKNNNKTLLNLLKYRQVCPWIISFSITKRFCDSPQLSHYPTLGNYIVKLINFWIWIIKKTKGAITCTASSWLSEGVQTILLTNNHYSRWPICNSYNIQLNCQSCQSTHPTINSFPFIYYKNNLWIAQGNSLMITIKQKYYVWSQDCEECNMYIYIYICL